MSVLTKDINQKEKKSGTSSVKEKTFFALFVAGVVAAFAYLVGSRKEADHEMKAANKEALKKINTMEFAPFVDDTKETSELFHEMSFLKKMISGFYANSSESSFSLEEDKKLFHKYKDLGKAQQEQAYEELEKKLNESLEVS
jgi:hypothetical protein